MQSLSQSAAIDIDPELDLEMDIDGDTKIIDVAPVEPIDQDPLQIIRGVVLLSRDTLLTQVTRVRDHYYIATRGQELPWPLAVQCLDEIRRRRGIEITMEPTAPIPDRLLPVAHWLKTYAYTDPSIRIIVWHIQEKGTARDCPWIDPEDLSHIEELIR